MTVVQDPEMPSAQILSIVYEGLHQRIRDNFDLQWRGPTFALTAQSFLFVGFVEASLAPHLRALQVTFGFLIFVAGAVSSYVMARADTNVTVDQHALDAYEAAILGQQSEFLLHHVDYARRSERYLGKRRARNFAVPGYLAWMGLLLLISITGLAAGIWTWVAR